MYILYLSNVGRIVHIDIGDIHIQYTGPKSLIRFLNINSFEEGVIYVETKFKYGVEEDYIDVLDLLQEYKYNPEIYLPLITRVEIRDSI